MFTVPAATSFVPAPRPVVPTAPAATGFPGSFAGIGNLPPPVAHPGDGLMAYLHRCEPKLAVAVEWHRMAQIVHTPRGLTGFAQARGLTEPPYEYVNSQGELNARALRKLERECDALNVANAARSQRQGDAFAAHLRRCNPPLAVALHWGSLSPDERKQTPLREFSERAGLAQPPFECVESTGLLRPKRTYMLACERAAFDWCSLPPQRKTLASLEAMGLQRGLDRQVLLRYVPARELLPDGMRTVAEGTSDDALRAANRAVIRLVEAQRPELAATAVWQAAVAWSEKSQAERFASDLASFAASRKVGTLALRPFVNPAGDITAFALHGAAASPSPLKDIMAGYRRLPAEEQAAESPVDYAERHGVTRFSGLRATLDKGALLTKAQGVALAWHRASDAERASCKSLTQFAKQNGVNPKAVMFYVHATGAWKRSGFLTEEGGAAADVPPDEPIVIKDEPPETIHHVHDNRGPILQTPEGDDALLAALQPPQKRLRTDDVGALIERQHVHAWSVVGDALATAAEALPEPGRRDWLKAEKQRITEEARAWLAITEEERVRRFDARLRVDAAGELGQGVKAARDIAAFEVLGPYAGKFLPTPAHLERERERYGSHNVTAYLYGTQADGRTVSAFPVGNVLSKVNEGPSPEANNAGPIRLGTNVTFYVALRPIAAGEDVLVDYGPDYDRAGWRSHPIAVDDRA